MEQFLPGLPRPNSRATPLRSTFVAALVLGAALLSPGQARAADGETSVWLGASLANAGAVSSEGPQLGVAAQSGAVFSMSQFWSLELGIEGAHHFAASFGEESLQPATVSDGWVGLRYNLDVFTYVPYVAASAVLYPTAPPTRPGVPPRASVGAKLTAGADWRFDRHWSLGVRADLHAVHLAVGEFPNYSTLGFNLAYRFRL